MQPGKKLSITVDSMQLYKELRHQIKQVFSPAASVSCVSSRCAFPSVKSQSMANLSWQANGQ